nr:putative mannose 6-phosphate receptor-like protein C530.09c [Ciona intestinalis]|eukprot:XP_002126668.1 putative mannose 6-phosphate receptor-like protein C530.09c [Ciona intestinalis]
MFSYFFLIILLISIVNGKKGLVCKDGDNEPCRCDLVDGSGIIDISSLGNHSYPRWTNISAPTPLNGPLYSYNPCYPFTDGNLKNLAALQIASGDKYDIGSQTTAVFVQVGDQIAINYTANSLLGDSRHSQVTLTCSKGKQDNFIVKGEVTPNSGFYKFELVGNTLCPKKSGGGLSAGSVLLIIFFVLLFVYLVGGILYNRYKNEETGLDMLPNKEFWASLPGLIADGIKFIFGGCKASPSSYDNI